MELTLNLDNKTNTVTSYFNLHELNNAKKLTKFFTYPNMIFFFTSSPSRDNIDLPTTKSQVPKALLC